MQVTCLLLAEQAQIFFEKLYLDSDKKFMASSGFIWRFEKRHNIRSMVEHGEQASADQNDATKFVEDFKDVRKLYTLDQFVPL